MTRAARPCIAAVAAGLALIAAPAASARTAHYEGEGVNLQAGQTRGLPILIGFDLRGRGCPSGPHCFDHATVSKVGAVSWAYPDCVEVLDGAFEVARAFPVEKPSPHAFRISSPSDDYAQDHVTVAGRFLRHGKLAKGAFTVTDGPCSTGTVHWTALYEP